MSRIAIQEVTLRIPFNPDEENSPEFWNYQQLLDTPEWVDVVSCGEVEVVSDGEG